MKKTYFTLNNMVNIPQDGKIPVQYDQDAVTAYFKEEILPRTKTFASFDERLDWMMSNDYLDDTVYGQYNRNFVHLLDGTIPCQGNT